MWLYGEVVGNVGLAETTGSCLGYCPQEIHQERSVRQSAQQLSNLQARMKGRVDCHQHSSDM